MQTWQVIMRYHVGLSLTRNVLLQGGNYSGMGCPCMEGYRSVWAYLLSKATVNLKLLSQNLLQHHVLTLETAGAERQSQPWHLWLVSQETAIKRNWTGTLPTSVISEPHQWSCAQVPPANGKGTKDQKGKCWTMVVRKIFSSRYRFFKFYGLDLDTWNQGENNFILTMLFQVINKKCKPAQKPFLFRSCSVAWPEHGLTTDTTHLYSMLIPPSAWVWWEMAHTAWYTH